MSYINEGVWDRVIRMLLGVILAFVAWMMWPGPTGAVLLVLAAIALVTGVVGWCGLYELLGISTNKKVELICQEAYLCR